VIYLKNKLDLFLSQLKLTNVVIPIAACAKAIPIIELIANLARGLKL
jgi:hypothetical protein